MDGLSKSLEISPRGKSRGYSHRFRANTLTPRSLLPLHRLSFVLLRCLELHAYSLIIPINCEFLCMIERKIDRKGNTIDRSSLFAEKSVRMNVLFLCKLGFRKSV